MADERRRIYTANGAAARDAYVDFGGAQPVRQPRRLPEERPAAQPRIKAKTAVAPFTLIGSVAVVCMLILVIFGYVQLFEASSSVGKLQNRLTSLQQEQVTLRGKYEGRIDLRQIESRASEMGLALPKPEQTVYLNLSGSDCAEIFREEKTNVFADIVAAFEQSVTDLVAYLRPGAA